MNDITKEEQASVFKSRRFCSGVRVCDGPTLETPQKPPVDILAKGWEILEEQLRKQAEKDTKGV